MEHNSYAQLKYVRLPFGFSVQLGYVRPHRDTDCCADQKSYTAIKYIVKKETISFLTHSCTGVRSGESLSILFMSVLLPRLIHLVACSCLMNRPLRLRSFMANEFWATLIDLQERTQILNPNEVVRVSPAQSPRLAADSVEMSDWIDKICRVIYREVFKRTRPWYSHPKWHMHHWRISLKRL